MGILWVSYGKSSTEVGFWKALVSFGDVEECMKKKKEEGKKKYKK